MFNPSFPATCPYITAVGATHVRHNVSITQPEEAAATVIYSGGGFSNVFDLASYQVDAVEIYFEKHVPPYGSDRYNITQKSRGYPDVSANGVNLVMPIDGEFTYLYGTSASAPTFGSIVALINAARLDMGKGSAGFINPALYANPDMLNDITLGVIRDVEHQASKLLRVGIRLLGWGLQIFRVC
jgi:tripeptidyl-peptidase-1